MVKKSKWLAVLLLLALGLVCLAGCGGTEAPEEGGEPAVTGEPAVEDDPSAPGAPSAEDGPEATDRPAAADGTVVIKLGALAFTNIDAEEFDAKIAEVLAQEGVEGIQIKLAYFDTLSAMLLALQAGQIDYFSAPAMVVDYIVAGNDELGSESTILQPPPQLALSMAVMEEDTELLALLNDALASLKADGSIDALIAAHIDGASPAAAPVAAPLPVIPGAETIKVAVTGDMPPIDYTTAADEAAGFNVALLAAISERAGVNVELLPIDSGTRALAMSSGRADVVFWMLSDVQEGGDSHSRFSSIVAPDVPPGVALTDFYYTDTIKLVRMK